MILKTQLRFVNKQTICRSLLKSTQYTQPSFSQRFSRFCILHQLQLLHHLSRSLTPPPSTRTSSPSQTTTPVGTSSDRSSRSSVSCATATHHYTRSWRRVIEHPAPLAAAIVHDTEWHSEHLPMRQPRECAWSGGG